MTPPTLKLYRIEDPVALVQSALDRGLARILPQPDPDDLHREVQRVCMARLRAERRGQDTSSLPKRVRKQYAINRK